MGRSLSQQQQAVSALVQIFPPQTPLSSEGKERAFESLRGKDGNFAGRVKREQVEFEGERQEQIDLLIIPKCIHLILRTNNISAYCIIIHMNINTITG